MNLRQSSRDLGPGGLVADDGACASATAPLVPSNDAPPRRACASTAAPAAATGTLPTPIVVGVSLALHGVAAVAMAALPAASEIGLRLVEAEIDVEWAAPPEPVPVPEPPREPAPAEPEPAPGRAQPAPVAARPRSTPPAPAPEVARDPSPAPPAAVPAPPSIDPPSVDPPSIDEVFAEPAPPAAVLTGGPGSFEVPEGVAGGAIHGVSSGRGGGAVAQSSSVMTGPSIDEVRRARRAYARAIHDILAREARYPVAARAQRLQGRVELALRIGADGRLLEARLLASSGYATLDQAALETARRVSSFPPPPSLVPWNAREEIRTSLVYEVTRYEVTR